MESTVKTMLSQRGMNIWRALCTRRVTNTAGGSACLLPTMQLAVWNDVKHLYLAAASAAGKETCGPGPLQIVEHNGD